MLICFVPIFVFDVVKVCCVDWRWSGIFLQSKSANVSVGATWGTPGTGRCGKNGSESTRYRQFILLPINV